jgi:porin
MTIQAAPYQSGYGDLESFGGPESVDAQIKDADEIKPAVFNLEEKIQGYFEWKKSLRSSYGLATSTSLLLLYQHADHTQNSSNTGSGSIFRWQGDWTLLGADSKNQGKIQWRLENRTNLSTQSPSDLGSATGAASLNPGFGYSRNFDTDLSVLNWTQGFADGQAGVAVGRLDFAAYLDAFAFQTFSRGFLNRSFLVNPTLGTTGVGAIGIVVKGMVTRQMWLGAGLYDANAVSGDFDWDTLEQGEYLKHVEIGWSPSFARRRNDRIQLTWWSKDARQAAGVPKGSGWALSASWQPSDNFILFTRAGHSDGGAGVAAEDALSIGMEVSLTNTGTLSLGAGWAKLNQANFLERVDDEYVVEASWNIRLTRNFTLLPNLQVLFNPANQPQQDRIVVAGMRASISL